MRTLSFAVLTAVGLTLPSLPAAAVPGSPVSGISVPSDMFTNVRMRGHHMRRRPMTWVQRRS